MIRFARTFIGCLILASACAMLCALQVSGALCDNNCRRAYSILTTHNGACLQYQVETCYWCADPAALCQKTRTAYDGKCIPTSATNFYFDLASPCPKLCPVTPGVLYYETLGDPIGPMQTSMHKVHICTGLPIVSTP
jgi:hypothetical protein